MGPKIQFAMIFAAMLGSYFLVDPDHIWWVIALLMWLSLLLWFLLFYHDSTISKRIAEGLCPICGSDKVDLMRHGKSDKAELVDIYCEADCDALYRIVVAEDGIQIEKDPVS